MTYYDVFAAAVPTAARAAYEAHTKTSAQIFHEHGAERLVELWGDDVPDGTLTSFPLAVQKAPDETVVVGWIIWPSKAARDAGMAKIMADPRMQPDQNPMPFDGARMIFGGFTVLLDA